MTVLALRDTGNTLQDPLTGRPVVVIEGARVQSLVPELPLLDRQSLSDPVALLRDLGGQAGSLRLQLLPYRAVGVPSSLYRSLLFCSEAKKPGAMALTRMPTLEKWTASHWVKLVTAALEEE